MVICNVAKILELVVPLMDHPSETFLTTIEEDLMKLIIKYGMTVSKVSILCTQKNRSLCFQRLLYISSKVLYIMKPLAFEQFPYIHSILFLP